MYKKLLALSMFSGTIIGVGLFGLPYVTAQIGFIPMLFYFLILGTVMITIQLMYSEISLRTIDNHRLPGYSKIYLNKWAEFISYTTTITGLIGALLAYIIVGGEFLANLMIPMLGGTVLLYSVIFFVFGAAIVFFGAGPVSKTEFLSLGLFFVILIILFFKALPHVNPEFFTTVNLNLKNILLPYGVILFALGGMAVVPEMKEILKKQEGSMKKLIIIGSIIPIITYLIFIVIVFGVTGSATTQEGMVGLNLALGNSVVYLGFLFGIITTFTSFLTLGITLKKELHYDRGLPMWLAWIFACFPPFILFLLGLKDFINIIGFIGAVALGIDVIIITFIYLKAKKLGQRVPAYSLNIPRGLIIVFVSLFIIGIIAEIVNLAL